MIIASFPKGSFPENSWPVGTWPVAPAEVVIRYTEVMDFAVCIATSAEFDVIMPNDEIVTVAYPDIVVSGATGENISKVNGTWGYYAMYNGKPQYTYNSMYISWTGTYWLLHFYYYSADNVATPNLVTTWMPNGHSETVPTVTAKPASTLTELAAFTVEMPMIIDFELYEELSA